MINSLFKPSVNRNTTYSPYFVNRPVPETAIKANHQHKYKKYKLFLSLLLKSSQRVYKQYWDHLVNQHKQVSNALTKLVSHSDKNMSLSVFLAF